MHNEEGNKSLYPNQPK